MTINASKTYCLRVGRLETGEEGYKAPGGEDIEYVTSMKDLGVIMDHKGTFKQHITKVRNRCMQVSAWLL